MASNTPNRQVDGGHIEQGETPLDERIDYLVKQRHTASTAMVYSEHGRLDDLQSISEEVPKLYNRARAELAASMRDDRVR
ncbi:MAG: hypothetical protein EOR16_30955 [Mesorhizobium sp.]|uniref:hypothetical protein n=1 Tax=Mesorhizobium sp. TaxID=1871066 RepID=UPI000FE94F8A|nr:hypothetical protein [Mesorhizobium sp.]RWI50076.1 MAG: hypothetical protein EOR16_30955 [Mesorhizobium sp.]